MMQWQLFGDLPSEEIRRVLAMARRRTFGRGEVVFHEGDPADSLHLIAKGRFAVRVTTPLGETATLAIRGPGDLVGEFAGAGHAPTRSCIMADFRTLAKDLCLADGKIAARDAEPRLHRRRRERERQSKSRRRAGAKAARGALFSCVPSTAR